MPNEMFPAALSAEIVDVAPPFSPEDIDTTTAQIIEALRAGGCTLLKNKANYRTDRPAHIGKPESTHGRGNSESEVSYPLDLGKVCSVVGIKSPALCINSLRMYGQISQENPLHFHGYSNPSPGKMEFIIFSVKMISTYDPSSGDVHVLRCCRNGKLNPEWEGKAPLVFIYENDGLVQHIAPEAGDMVILPSGVFHEFSCLPGVFVDLSSIEVASDVAILSGGSWKRDDGSNPFEVIAATIAHETGTFVPKEDIGNLTLADIPSLVPYVETSRPRLDSQSLH